MRRIDLAIAYPLDSFDIPMSIEPYHALKEWFKTLRYRHSASTHAQIIESLEWQEVRLLFNAACTEYGLNGDFDIFAAGILWQARLAQVRGLVRPDGERRRPGGGRKSGL